VSLDARVRRGLDEVAPADPSGAYERVVEKKIRRRFVRRTARAVLSIGVVAITALGFLGLTRVFERPTNPPAGVTSPPRSTPTQGPAPTEPPLPGRDIGLPVNLCGVQTLIHVHFLGEGKDGTAWTGAPVDDAGRCPTTTEDTYVVAADLTGDGVADDVWRALEHCFMCEPYAAADLDGDGEDELVVLENGGTTPRFDLFDVRSSAGEIRLRPIVVAPPGDARTGFPAGEPAHIVTGGDEGFSGYVSCERYPQRPEIVVAWADGPIDGPGFEWRDVHVARLVIEDGVAHVVDSSNDRAASDADLAYPFGTDNVACGLDWNPF
jgi:hypothetical protein